MDREALVAEAKTWLGTPFHHAANLKGVGADCGQWLYQLFLDCGVISPSEIQPYSLSWAVHTDDNRYIDMIERYALRVADDDTRPGNIIIFKFGRAYSHGALITGWPNIIHIARHDGCCVDDVLNGPLSARERVIYSVFED